MTTHWDGVDAAGGRNPTPPSSGSSTLILRVFLDSADMFPEDRVCSYFVDDAALASRPWIGTLLDMCDGQCADRCRPFTAQCIDRLFEALWASVHEGWGRERTDRSVPPPPARVSRVVVVTFLAGGDPSSQCEEAEDSPGALLERQDALVGGLCSLALSG